MTYIDRRMLSIEQEKELIELGFILSFQYSLAKDLNIFDVFGQ